MGQVNALHSDIIELYDTNGLSAEEIAEITGTPKWMVEDAIAEFERILADASWGDIGCEFDAKIV